MSDSFVMVIGALMLFAASAILAIISNRRKARIAASATWPSVTGTVLSNAVKIVGAVDPGGGSRAPTYSVDLRYRYTAGGTDYESSRIGWGTKSADREIDIPQAFVGNYPPGHAIDVFYDPADPATAMIDPTGSRFRLVHVNFAGVMAWTLGFCGLLLLVFAALSARP
jgi:hypothetical protein